MRVPHLVRVAEGPEAFRELFTAAAARGHRLGWLSLTPPAPPLEHESAAVLGATRAVSVGAGRVLATKPQKGQPVLKDLLREHFLGCAAVLIEAPGGAPLSLADPQELGAQLHRLERQGEVWRLHGPAGQETLTLEKLGGRLGRLRLAQEKPAD
ncbi:MAG TPA: hypothetical protein PK413_11595 [Thermoanaerobaculia bacterium]|nr:hypothetical protein [Thermoanaerobaculia bacterium]